MLVTLAAIGCHGSGPRPHTLTRASASRQTGRPDQAVGSGPAVMVLDRSGKPVEGVPVAFAAIGGGSATPETVASGADGIARTVWRLGTAGPQSLLATTPEIPGASLDFSAELLTAPGYKIDLRLLTTASDAQWAAFTGAAARIAEAVVGDLTTVDVAGSRCGGTLVGGQVEDLLIVVRIHDIDGPGNVLGQAGPCVVRLSSRLPAVGVMELDSADLDRLEERGTLASVILHEMLHVVGFGTVWGAFERSPQPALISGAGTSDSAFIGAQALAEATGSNGAPGTWTSVPLENCGTESPRPCGSGTRDAHWLEPEFGSELMTGWLSGASQPLSGTTIGSLADLGYVVNLDAADPFDLASGAIRGEAVASPQPGEYVGDDILRIPVAVVP